MDIKKITALTPLLFIPSISYSYTGYSRTAGTSGDTFNAEVTAELGDVDWVTNFNHWKICIFDDTENGNTTEADWINNATHCGDPVYTTTGYSSVTISNDNINILGVSIISWTTATTSNNFVWSGPDMEWETLDSPYNYSTNMFVLEQVEEAGFTLINEDSNSNMASAIGSNTGSTFVSVLPIVAIIIGFVLAISISNWLVDSFDKAFNREMEKSKKIRKETKDLLDR